VKNNVFSVGYEMERTYALPAGTILYRAADTVERNPTPRECPDTGKTGVYFSALDPYLAETMTIERNRPLEVAVHELARPVIHISDGKYAFRQGRKYNEMPDPLPDEYNLSHIDFNVEPTHRRAKPLNDACAELFLTPPDLDAVKFKRYYRMTVREARRRYLR
jgi:hypothetical protein